MVLGTSSSSVEAGRLGGSEGGEQDRLGGGGGLVVVAIAIQLGAVVVAGLLVARLAHQQGVRVVLRLPRRRQFAVGQLVLQLQRLHNLLLA
eukprot:2426096-Pleurochrysis_carterae.AAC.1